MGSGGVFMSNVRSVQRGFTQLTSSVQQVTLAISSVNMTKAFIKSSVQASAITGQATVLLASPTSIQITKFAADAYTFVTWEVIEYV